MFEIVNRLDGFPAEDLHGVLVSQVVAALDGVEHVPFPMVFFHIAERGANTALRRSRVRARGIELAQHRDVPVPGHLQRGHQAGAPRSHDHCVILLDHVIKPQKRLSVISYQSSESRFRELMTHDNVMNSHALPTLTYGAIGGWNVKMAIDPSVKRTNPNNEE